MVEIELIASDKNWIEGAAVEQLKQAAGLPGMVQAVGMPDLHPGKGSPVGAAFITKGILYPYLIGNDIGCGMGLWKTNERKIKRDKWGKRLSVLEDPWDGDAGEWMNGFGVNRKLWENSLGSIGGGNHFAELQVIESIEDKSAFDALRLDRENLYLLVHSGSRGLGETILRDHVDKYKAAGIDEISGDAMAYMDRHDEAVRWARANRALIAQRFLDAIGTEGELVLDVAHNSITKREMDGEIHWLHRKGAAPADEGPVVVPGSRGAMSYIVQPLTGQTNGAFSIAHGAGRKWNRSSVKGKLGDKFTAESLMRTDLGSLVICNDKNLLYEEAPQAYKNIDIVVNDMVEANLVRIVARLRPVMTYKVTK